LLGCASWIGPKKEGKGVSEKREKFCKFSKEFKPMNSNTGLNSTKKNSAPA
jgi:hypothetical protein